MKFKNKKTNEIVETKNYAQTFAYSHNSNYEIATKAKEPTVDEIKVILDEKGIPYDSKAKKPELLALLPQE